MNRRSLYVLLGILFSAWVFHKPLLAVLVDWWWFEALGYTDIFTTSLSARLGLWLTGFLVSAGVIVANISIATREAPINYRRMAMLVAERGITPQQMRLLVRGLVAAWIILPGLLFAGGAASMWMEVLTFINGGDFGQVDPVFGLDIGFYVFQLPLLEYVQDAITGLLLVTLFPLLGFYVVRDLLINHDTHVGLSSKARRHLLALGALVFTGFAAGWFLDRFRLLTSHTGVVWGVGYTDETATLPAMAFMVGLCLFFAAALVFCMVRYDWRVPAGSVGVYFVASIGAQGFVPELVQDYVVKPSELQKEASYLARNIAATREAYNLADVEVQPFDAAEGLTLEDIQANPLTIDNIRIWDDRPLLTTYGQIQEIRLYYEFHAVDVDRYTIDGKPRQVMLAARELNYANVPAQAQSWVNEHFQYTHGYGVTVSPVNVVTAEGLPDLMVKDIPPVSVVPELEITRPEIYYGELSDRYVFVNTNAQEFDYPSGDDNVYTTYAGEGGVGVGSLARRLVFASWLGTFDIVLSTYLNDDSKVMFRRRILERVDTIAPFLRYDDDPYLVIDEEGRLKWILDAYTTTSRYPYSEPTLLAGGRGRFNYIRNSVKVVIDAYHGSVDFYIADDSDPIIQAYSAIFEGSFRPLSEMPADLQAHIRYPTGYFHAQTEKYRAYHMKDPTVFYNKEDMWDRPKETYEAESREMSPYYLIMKLPGEEVAEFILLMPFVPTKKDNMISWLAARSDGEEYGKLILYSFPKQKLVYGPKQIEARIDQDPEISGQLTLWSSAGSRVLRGNLLVIPIEDSLMYVEPVYLQAEQGELPQLKRVIVSYEDMVVMEHSLQDALDKVFGMAEVEVEVEAPTDSGLEDRGRDRTWAELSSAASGAYSDAIAAQKEGDWAGYGEALERLGNLLEHMLIEAGAQVVEEPFIDEEGGLE